MNRELHPELEHIDDLIKERDDLKAKVEYTKRCLEFLSDSPTFTAYVKTLKELRERLEQ